MSLPDRIAAHLTLMAVLLVPPAAFAQSATPIVVPGDQAYTESITAGPDGSLYVSSFAAGGVQRVNAGATKAEPWIPPGAFDSRSTFGLYADAKTSTLWVCSNDVSGFGVPGPNSIAGSHLKAFDLASGEGKASYAFPAGPSLCNDMTIAADGTLYVTDTVVPRILRLAPGAKALEIFIEDKQFQPPNNGAGLDGIALGEDGHLYVNTFHGGELFRIEIADGKAGAVTKLKTSRPLSLPDGLRRIGAATFLMAEGSGTLDRVTIEGDTARIETIKDGLKEPTAFAKIGDTAWVAEGQLSHLLAPKEKGPPSLPFEIVPVHVGN